MMLAGYEHLLRAAARLQWDDAAIPVERDAQAFARLPPPLQDELARLLAGFCLAETAVAEHLAPFEAAAADPLLARCFAVQANDERRHARFFARVACDVAGIPDPAAVAPPQIHTLFGDELPRTAAALAAGSASLDRAVGLYHLVLEGIVFAAGQERLVAVLDAAGTLPHVRDGVTRVQADERWHVGLGVRCLHDLGVTDPELGELPAIAAAVWSDDADGAAELLRRHRRRLALAA